MNFNQAVEEFNRLIETYDLKEVEFLNSENFNESLHFENLEEFENFLENEDKKINKALLQKSNSAQSGPIMFAAASTATKTYTYKEYTGVSTITSYAKVTRNTKGIVTKVLIWSSQTGCNR